MGGTVRIDPEAHAALTAIARVERVSLTEALSHAIETHRRKLFLDGLASDYAALHDDPKSWREEMTERGMWDSTAMDGLGGEPRHPDAREPKRSVRPRRVRRKSVKARGR